MKRSSDQAFHRVAKRIRDEQLEPPRSPWGLTGDAFHSPHTTIYRVVQAAVWGLIFLSVLLLLIDLSGALPPEDQEKLRRLDRLVLWLFAFEIGLRVLTFRPPTVSFFSLTAWQRLREEVLGRLRYCLRPLVLIDILTVVALVPALRGLRALRVLRLLRSTRLLRYSNPLAGLGQALRENALLFVFAFLGLTVTVFLAGVSFWLAESAQQPEISSLGDGLWWSLVTITTVGYGDITPKTTTGQAIGVFLMIAGMFNLAFFAGIVGRTLIDTVMSLREEQFRMSDYVDHVVICGFDPGSAMLLGALRKEFDLSRTTMVIFAPGDRPAQVGPEFLWVSGNPAKESELGKVRITHAKAAILVGPRDVDPQHADASTILTAFTIRRYMKLQPESASRRNPLYIVAEVLDAENVEHARTAGADEVVETTRVGFSLLAHAVSTPGAARFASRVAFAEYPSIFVGCVPKSDGEALAFGELSRQLKEEYGVLLLGVQEPGSIFSQMNPADDYRVHPSMRLVYLADRPLAALSG